MSKHNDLKKQIAEQERRLQTLKEQEALSDIKSSPEILNEIKEIETNLSTLRTRLKRPDYGRWLRWTVIVVALFGLIMVVQSKADLLPLWWATRCLPDCPGRNLSELDLIEATLRKPRLNEGDLSGANLSEANLSRSNLPQANLSEANLSWTKLNEANLSGADLRGADLREANLHGTSLHRANLRGANLRKAHLSGVNLHWADLSGTDLREANLHGTSLDRANLRGADLREANLRGADLYTANLREANLRGVNCDETTQWPDYLDLDQAGIRCVNRPPAAKEMPAGERQPPSSCR